ncbi:hypothetical protein [Streptomyces antimicrobicus]|uniref:hypothetical protein n=1 Tax=Streptomyces antimicrobicus TaxID=2883108 RepID=UPI0035ABECB7
MAAGGGGFEPATGDGPAPTVPAGTGAADSRAAEAPGAEAPGAGARAAEVRAAFEGLLQIRRTVNGEAGADVPAPWERQRPVRAVALALEAAGLPPSAVDPADGPLRTATGYVVGPGEAPGRARVTWAGPPGGGAAAQERERLGACAEVLGRLGWQCLLYRGPRGRRFLEVEPPR